MSNENPNFLDTRTIIAVVLMSAAFVGWQYYLQAKYPQHYAAKPATPVAENRPAVATESTTMMAAAKGGSATSPEAPIQGASSEEHLIHYQSDTIAFDLSSRGMGVKTVQILKFKNRRGEVIEIGHPNGSTLALETRGLGRSEPLDFNIERVNANLFVGHAQYGNTKITKTIEINPEKYLLECKVVASPGDEHFIGLSTALTDEVETTMTPNPLRPEFQKQEFFVDTSEAKADRVVFAKDNVQKSWGKVKLAALGSQYFTEALIDKSAIMPEAKGTLNRQSKTAEILLNYPVLAHDHDFELNYSAFVGPKSMHILREVDADLVHVVDYGYFSYIGRYILELLKLFYSLVGNWGVAVVCLTVVVRLLVLPVNIYSYKSMRAMQAIQPQLQALRERYKDDQQKQQQETMALMRTHKVNPVGGCLPIFLQLPIFFALYQFLGNSIELYQAPFGLWIQDLSLKDPFYILPVLMGVTMFVQQKTTPTTMDPAQAKMMLMMPVVFAFFMSSLPSGLTLYMLIGAVFSVVQQAYFMRQPKPALASAK